MLRVFTIAVVLSAFMGAAGCAPLLYDRRSAQMRDRVEFDNLKVDVQRLQDRVDGMATAQQDIFRELEALHAARGTADEATKARLDGLERSVKTVSDTCDRLRGEIADDLAKRMNTLLQTSPSRRGPAEQGYEHVVKPGETLSQIAAAYKVTISAIVKANNLSSPDAIRAGQKLFIPE